MVVPVVWLSYREEIPSRGYWDDALFEDYFSGQLWGTEEQYAFEHRFDLLNLDGAVIVFPGRAQVDYIDQLNKDISCLKWVVLIITGDEEGLFPIDKIEHPNMELWVMSAKPGARGHPFLNGYTPQTKLLDGMSYQKETDWFFAGQVTHKRRELCAAKLKEIGGGVLVETEGFTKGLPHAEYFEKLAGAKVAPCPSGPQTPDTFRLYEALEAHSIPIVDIKTPENNYPDYWGNLFGEEVPFPVIRCDYESLPSYMSELLADYPASSNKVVAWWLRYKRKLTNALNESIHKVSGCAGDKQSDITVLMPASPVRTNPSTDMIEETILSVRNHLPTSEIILMFDRPTGADSKYDEHIAKCLWLCNHRWKNILPLIFDKHTQQASMTKIALSYVKTPAILFVEHDAPLVPDYEIPFNSMLEVIVSGYANVIRLHHEALVLPEHEHLMMDKDAIYSSGVPMLRTYQWSQRPHLASTVFYRKMLKDYFPAGKITFIEDIMHGVLDEVRIKEGKMGWYNFRVCLYAPEGNIKRSYHLDGRKS